MEENDNNFKNGIIYKITNLVNDKIYIGKTKEYRGKTKFGINARFQEHIQSALSEKGGCPLLNKAIRKYGPENFVIEKLLNCTLEEIDDFEIKTIKEYNSTNRDIGYNIALGGKGRSVVHVNEEARMNISSSLKKNKTADNNADEMNIKPVNRNGKLVGYRIKRREKKQYNKWFTSSKYTPEENLEKAKKWLEDFKNNDIRLNTKETGLPENISYDRNKKGEIAGYKVSILKNGEKFSRTFISGNQTMEHKLKQALAYKDSVLDGKPIEKENSNLKHNDLPKNVNIYKNKNGEIIGYVGKIIVNKKMQKKLFIKVDVPMEEKLKQAIEYVNSILNTK